MHSNRGTRITIETESTLIIRRTRTARNWCAECQLEVDFVQLQHVHQFLQKDWSELAGGNSSHKLHRTEGKDGSVLICMESLLKFK